VVWVRLEVVASFGLNHNKNAIYCIFQIAKTFKKCFVQDTAMCFFNINTKANLQTLLWAVLVSSIMKAIKKFITLVSLHVNTANIKKIVLTNSFDCFSFYQFT